MFTDMFGHSLWKVGRETGDAVKHPTMYKLSLTTKDYPVRNGNSAEVEEAQNSSFFSAFYGITIFEASRTVL